MEGFEEVFLYCGRQSRTSIAHRDEHVVWLGPARHDLQFSRPLGQRARRFHGVDDQVKDHLLQFDPVAADERHAVGKLRPHQDAVLHRFATSKLDDFLDRRIDVHAVIAQRRFLDEIAYALDDVPRPRGVPDDALERLPNFVQFRWVEAKKA